MQNDYLSKKYICLILAIWSGIASSGHAETTTQTPMTGIAKFSRKAQLTFGVSGRIERILVEEGNRVEKGQLVAQLWDDAAAASLEEAIAAAQSRGALEIAESEHLAALSDLRAVQRANQIHAGAFSVERTRQSEIAVQRASKAIQQQKDALTTAGAAKHTAEKQLESLSLLAPFSGMIVRRFKTDGEGVDPISPVVELVDSSRIRIEFFIEESELSAYQRGSEIEIVPVFGSSSDAANLNSEENEFLAVSQVGFVDVGIQPVRRVVRAWAELARPDWLREGMRVVVRRTDRSLETHASE